MPLKLASQKCTSKDYQRAKAMRSAPTSGEDILWYKIRIATKNKNFRFRRQHPIHPYIVDFICLKLKLVIEIDGQSHTTRFEKDVTRDERLRNMGYEVLRFTNSEVISNRDGVVTHILNCAEKILMNTYTPHP